MDFISTAGGYLEDLPKAPASLRVTQTLVLKDSVTFTDAPCSYKKKSYRYRKETRTYYFP